jgi:hypothetical protein
VAEEAEGEDKFGLCEGGSEEEQEESEGEPHHN